jgi:dTDP-4-dehydrorhamnose reductase
MRLFLTGGTGYLGQVLLRQARDQGWEVVATHFSQSPPVVAGVSWLALDVRDPDAVMRAVAQARPDALIHTAFRQYDPNLFEVTAAGSGHVARAAAASAIRMIHMSSDVIFDGERSGAYREADPPAPISPYGEAKAQAELLVTSLYPEAAIVRTSLIYGFDPVDRQTQFALEVADGQRDARLFSDEIRCPVYVEDLAAALLELLHHEHRGVIHLAGAEAVSRYELGRLMAQAFGRDPVQIRSGLSSESGVRRPRNCALQSDLARTLLQQRLRGLREVLRDQGLI